MPYGNVVDLKGGSQQLLTTRERPKMLFNSAGEPTHLFNGVCPSPGNFTTPFSCPTVSTGCVDCKVRSPVASSGRGSYSVLRLVVAAGVASVNTTVTRMRSPRFAVRRCEQRCAD